MASAAFVQKTGVQLLANVPLGIDASTAQTQYTAGAMPYHVFTPSTAAVAAAGFDPANLPILVSLHGTGCEYTTSADIGVPMIEQYSVPLKLGYGSAQDGHLASPDANWPTLCVFPQNPNLWSGSATDSSARRNRAAILLIDAVLDDVIATYGGDRSRIIFVGQSGGAGLGMEYHYARGRWPTVVKYDMSCLISGAGQISGSGFRQDFPWMEQGENSNNQTIPRIAKQWCKRKVPIWMFNSTNDSAANGYGQTVTNIQLFDGLSPATVVPYGLSALTQRNRWFRFTEYQPAAALTHGPDWGAAYGNGATGGSMVYTDELWAWGLAQRFYKRPPTPSPLRRARRVCV